MLVQRKRVTDQEQEKLKKKERIAQQEAITFLRTTIESTADGILVVDRKGKIIIFNQKFAKMWKLPPRLLKEKLDDEAIGYVVKQLKDPNAFVQTLTELYKKISTSCLDEIEFKDGRIFERYSIPQRLGKRIIGRVFSFRDVTKRKSLEAKLVYQATYDSLTGVHNRTVIMDRIEQAIKYADRYNTKIAVVFIDLDRFKGINDSLGHNIGDLVLKEVSTRFLDVLRTTDTLVRWGGDEFSIILENLTSKNDAMLVLKRLLDTFSEPFQFHSHLINTTCSVGVSFYPLDGKNAITLLKQADVAMYYAKNESRNTYKFYKPEMTEKAMEILEIENDLTQALKEEDQLHLHYQPIVSVHTQRVESMEVLLRWHHPKRQWISPVDFIPIAEDTGLIIALGTWAIEATFKQVKEWQNKGILTFKVAINVSTYQLKHKNFISNIQKIIKKYDVSPHHIIIEVTETRVMENANFFLKILQELDRLGFTISIDDFGTGYSSLTYLHLFPIKKLKIDRSFISNCNKEGKVIILAIIAMAKKLDFKTVAEGVETKEQLDFLIQNNCDEIQGFYFSKPLPPNDVEIWLKANSLLKFHEAS